jgi:hypothetical protein
VQSIFVKLMPAPNRPLPNSPIPQSPINHQITQLPNHQILKVPMGDAGEGLIDADSRIQERMEELERERSRYGRRQAAGDPERRRTLESLRLARTELERQLAVTVHERRRAQIADAIAEIDRRLAAAAEPGAGGGVSA